MPEQKKHTWVYVLGGTAMVWLVLIGLSKQIAQQNKPAPQTRYNYTQTMCDDAFKQQGPPPEARDLDHFDIKLEEGCFSVMYGAPDGWRHLGMQLLGKDKTDWLAMWPQSSNRPFGPFSYDEFNFQMDNWKQQNLDDMHGGLRFRLQGKGRVLIFRTAR
jgi:hypothetical protein